MKKLLFIGLFASLAGISLLNADIKDDLAKAASEKANDTKKEVGEQFNAVRHAAQRRINPTIAAVEDAIIAEVEQSDEYAAYWKEQSIAERAVNRINFEKRIAIASVNATRNHCFERTAEAPFFRHKSGCQEGIAAARAQLLNSANK